MAARVTLDAMIKRTDFATIAPEETGTEQVVSVGIEQLVNTAMFGGMLRKPDFQRETNYWTPDQVVSFLESYANNELVPSAILWRSSAFVFVIDGGHRLSALRAWIEDDYGDGAMSSKFFNGEIPSAQKKAAEKTRREVNERVGSYSRLRAIHADPEGQDPILVKRARNIATRAISFQWVLGNADKAEGSFFKINTQGTALDKIEESLLRHRKKTASIAARSIVRAATGHRYWSTFAETERNLIESTSKRVHKLLFTPEIDSPIRTLDLPLGGHKSNIDALGIMIDVFAIAGSPSSASPLPVDKFPDDEDGKLTIELLKKADRIVSWIAGNGPNSLGLHPAIYYYSDRGRHIPDLFLGMILFVSRILEKNEKHIFQHFSANRLQIEQTLIEKKSLILQALQLLQSKYRVEKTASFLRLLSDKAGVMSDEEVVTAISPNSTSRIISIREAGNTTGNFTDNTKSAIAIRQSLQSAVRCSICHGYLDPIRSTSYDHVIPARENGSNEAGNGAMSHPFCNTGVKN